MRTLEQAGVPSAPINDIEQVVNDPHIRNRNMVIKTEDPIAGSIDMAGNPIKYSNYEDPHTRLPAPELDADRQEILKWLDR